MRRRFAIPLIAFAGLLPWYWFKPAMQEYSAELVSVLDLEHREDWFGGLSGFDLTSDGATFHLVTDRGHRATGRISRADGVLSGFDVIKHQPTLDGKGRERQFPHTDGEGLAIAPDGSVYISFERAHRVLHYPSWDGAAQWPSYTRSWRALWANRGLEAVAIDDAGTLYTLPEAVLPGAWEALIYRRHPRQKWEQPFTIPVDRRYKPVGADFGPDGRFYVLERGIYPFGFYSRVRSMILTETEATDIVTNLETPLARHGNLEGLAVWQDSEGFLRLTMVSDNNFKFFMRTQLVEYRLPRGVAQPAQ